MCYIGLARGRYAPPSNPLRPAALPGPRLGASPPFPPSGALMADRRTAVVRARVLPSEHAAWRAKAAAAGVSPSDLLR